MQSRAIFHAPSHVAFFFYKYGHHRDLHSFPTRRSSDLRTRCCAWSTSSGSRSSSTAWPDRKSTRLELQSPYDLVCRLLLEKKKRASQRGYSARREGRQTLRRRGHWIVPHRAYVLRRRSH